MELKVASYRCHGAVTTKVAAFETFLLLKLEFHHPALMNILIGRFASSTGLR